MKQQFLQCIDTYTTLTTEHPTLKCLEKFRDFQIIRAFKQLAYKSFDIPS